MEQAALEDKRHNKIRIQGITLPIIETKVSKKQPTNLITNLTRDHWEARERGIMTTSEEAQTAEQVLMRTLSIEEELARATCSLTTRDRRTQTQSPLRRRSSWQEVQAQQVDARVMTNPRRDQMEMMTSHLSSSSPVSKSLKSRTGPKEVIQQVT